MTTSHICGRFSQQSPVGADDVVDYEPLSPCDDAMSHDKPPTEPPSCLVPGQRVMFGWPRPTGRGGAETIRSQWRTNRHSHGIWNFAIESLPVGTRG